MQLLVKEAGSEKAIGFLTFKDTYDLYCGFMDTRLDEANFCDHLLDQDHGLCVYITTICKIRFIILQNEITDIGQLLLEQIEDEADRNSSIRYCLDKNLCQEFSHPWIQNMIGWL